MQTSNILNIPEILTIDSALERVVGHIMERGLEGLQYPETYHIAEYLNHMDDIIDRMRRRVENHNVLMRHVRPVVEFIGNDAVILNDERT